MTTRMPATATAPWHGPHESPTPMTFPLMALAVGAVVAGFVGIPAALGGGNAIEHFLEPSFTASRARSGAGAAAATRMPRREPAGERARGAARVARRRARPDGVLAC